MVKNSPRVHPAQAGGARRARFIQNCMRAARERAHVQAQKAAVARWKFLSGDADRMGGRELPVLTLAYVSIQHVDTPAPTLSGYAKVGYRRVEV